MRFRTLCVGAGAVLVSVGVCLVAWAVANEVDTLISYGLLVAILGVQVVTLGAVLKLLASDWPPTMLVAAGMDMERRRVEREQRASRVAPVLPLRDRASGG